MKQIAGLFVILIAIMLSAAWLSKSDNSTKIFSAIEATTLSPSPSPEVKKTITVGGKTFFIEIADTPEKRQKGLSGRKELEKNSGLLFIFEKQNTRPPFWMKGMEMSIDIVWIDNDRVIQLNTDVKPEPTDTPDKDLRLYTPNQPVDQVLELSAGTVKEMKVRVGDKVEIPK
ncbi:MAG: hypothetical protein A3F61_01020 [Candidatus Blackburnbacteria bacterium RIFCSPHIGHO2_12_FULL_41_13b]|uniref:DUF192 domain-containing protein n=1 Tax=Candidatus Blackburnbacteria bacterium RIFCSPHIGHO2_12_FULL_41_13b TaxID=1797517 RepID=A0A1G1VAR4_9BACT|nr:MAG: hypothetical protein A3F61_01020 [Candidatus Blackburnbacteria bacterium RIFCSPHIGHO2_12_FULL_41_13b]